MTLKEFKINTILVKIWMERMTERARERKREEGR